MRLRENKSTQQLVLLCLVFLLFVVLSISSLMVPLRESLTYDEPHYYTGGEAILAGKASEVGANYNVMPMMGLYPLVNRLVTALGPSLVPGELEKVPRRLYQWRSAPEEIAAIYRAKTVTILVSLLLAFYIFLWSRSLYGPYAGLLATTLYLLDPNIIAHSRLVHQNIFETAAIFISVYYFWRLLKFGGPSNLVASIVSFGIAQITRITAIYLVPIYVILALVNYKARPEGTSQGPRLSRHHIKLARASRYAFILLVFTVLVINVGFSFEKTFVKLGHYHFRSQAFQELQSQPILQHLPIPLPYTYLINLDFGRYKQETGYASGLPYLMGELAEPNSNFGHYYLVAFLYKVPIATQVLIFISLLTLLNRKRWRDFWENEAFLLVPPIIFLLVMSATNAQLGLRYVLMIFPFLFVLSSRVAAWWPDLNYRYRAFILGLVLYLLVSNLSYYPHYLSYFNELLTDRKMSYTILADSNLDWGQNQYYLERYLHQHPETLYIRCSLDGRFRVGKANQPADRTGPMRIVVEANTLVGILWPKAPFFKWLRENKKPVDHVAYSYLVFELGPKDQPDLLKPVKANRRCQR